MKMNCQNRGGREYMKEGLNLPRLLAMVGVALMFVGMVRAQEQPFRFAGTTCPATPYLHCPDSECSGATVVNQGNVVEMILLGADGSMLSKESYKYEFDQLGNWTKLISSVAVYENGKIVFEPTGITYRTISYYYNQAIEKLNASSPKSNGASAPSSSSTLSPNSTASSTDSARLSTPSGQLTATSQPLSAAANAHAKTEMVKAPASVSPAAPASVSPAKNGTLAPESSEATSTPSEIRTTPDSPPATSVVQHVAEEDMRNAAIELPQPEYSAAALQAQASGKVKVQVLVDETGHVTTAKATSGHPLL